LQPALRHFFRFWLWFSSGTVTKEWVAVHRRHHVFADRPGDPHSPVVFSLKRVLLEGYELYIAAARDPTTLAHYGHGTPDDWLERNLYSRFPKIGIVLFCLVQLLLFGVPAITLLGVQLIAQPHNNHHAFPSSACFAVQRWEIDVGWLFICGFRALGLAHVGKVAPRPHLVNERADIDTGTVWALFTNRLHILRDYRRRVIKPVFRELTRQKNSVGLARSVSCLLVRHPKLLDEASRQQLHELLDRYEVLRTVIEFRDRLQRIWDETSATHGRALAQWREWSRQAEGSNIVALRRFARRLPTYAPATGASLNVDRLRCAQLAGHQVSQE
jgi:stearoyl-CoA desaturase (delta-9 desaturase)